MPLKMLFGPLLNMAESIYDTFRDQVHPVVGSIVYCDLALGYAEHSGIWVGENEIVHLNKYGEIEMVDPYDFMLGTTALNVYVSCKGAGAVGSEAVARLARSQVGMKRSYNFLLDNCHQFCGGCLTGDFDNPINFLWMLKDRAKKHLGVDNWRHWDVDEIAAIRLPEVEPNKRKRTQAAAATSKRHASKKAASKKTVSKKATSKKATSNKAAPKKAASKKAAVKVGPKPISARKTPAKLAKAGTVKASKIGSKKTNGGGAATKPVPTRSRKTRTGSSA